MVHFKNGTYIKDFIGIVFNNLPRLDSIPESFNLNDYKKPSTL